MARLANADREAAFVREYLADPELCGWKAAQRAGFAQNNMASAKSVASRLLNRPHIKQAIDAAMAERSARTEITADMVLERLWAIATADPNEISQYRRSACRHCHGKGHLYQWRDHAEWDEACARAKDKKKTAPSDDGGYGFDHNKDPHPDCPRCSGEGDGRTFIADTRRLKGAAKLLYAGVKETRDGIEAKMHDQMVALDKVARHLGMFKDRVELTGKDGGPVEVESKGGVSGLLAAARQSSENADRG